MARGLDAGDIASWLGQNLEGTRAPYRAELIAAGGSNLTYRLEDADGKLFALRRPPEGRRLATAHDVVREVRILRALEQSAVPVPHVFAVCEEEDRIGAPFFVMEFAHGRILRDRQAAGDLAPEACQQATDSLIDVQIALHSLDVDEIGLGGLARREGYVERQLARWLEQAHRSRTRKVPLLEAVHDQLRASLPPSSGRVSLVHGDYRFDNVVLDDSNRVRAVLDWELCTLGDPVADFCWSLLYWADPGDEYSFLTSAPTLHEAFPRRAEVAALWAARSGHDLSRLDYYTAFGWWKMACIVEGVYARLQKGTSGGMGGSEDLSRIADRVDRLLDMAARALDLR